MSIMRYDEWFAKEYRDHGELASDLRAIGDRLAGRKLEAVEENRESGFICLRFGTIRIYLWYPDGGHLKLRMDGRDMDAGGLSDVTADRGGLAGGIVRAVFAAAEPFGSPGTVTVLLDDGKGTAGISVYPGRGIRVLRDVGISGCRAVLSSVRIPMTENSFRNRICDMRTGEMTTSVTDSDGRVRIQAEYSDIQLGDSIRETYRVIREKRSPSGDCLTLYGACDAKGKELVPCMYHDLYCMVNGFFLVMDAEQRWWVLKDGSEAIYGPSIYGVDIYGNSTDFLFYVEYNENAGFECLGIYDVRMKTITCDAVFVKAMHLGGGKFAVTRVNAGGERSAEMVDEFGTTLSLMGK